MFARSVGEHPVSPGNSLGKNHKALIKLLLPKDMLVTKIPYANFRLDHVFRILLLLPLRLPLPPQYVPMVWFHLAVLYLFHFAPSFDNSASLSFISCTSNNLLFLFYFRGGPMKESMISSLFKVCGKGMKDMIFFYRARSCAVATSTSFLLIAHCRC